MAKKKLIIARLTADVFGAALTVYVNCTPEEMKKDIEKCLKRVDFHGVFNKEHTTEDGLYFRLKHSISGQEYPVIWIKDFHWRTADYGILAHEVLHATLQELRHRGLTDSRDSEEAYCYLFGYFYTEILKQLPRKL